MNKQELIEQRLEQALREGRWGVLERLPAERELAQEFGVNRGTLRAALCALAGRGLVETLPGSGTVVRGFPSESQHSAPQHLRAQLEAFHMLMPVVAEHCVTAARPSHILELERILPAAGLALRNKDMRAFVQAQLRFFSYLVRILNNPAINESIACTLPDARLFVRLMQKCIQPQHETLFAILARLLSALRHVNSSNAVAATHDYATTLLGYMEEAVCN